MNATSPKPSRGHKVPIQFRLHADTVEEIKALAREKRVSNVTIMEMAFAEYLKMEKARSAKAA